MKNEFTRLCAVLVLLALVIFASMYPALIPFWGWPLGLTMILGIIWGTRIVPFVSLNLWSYPFGAAFCMTVAALTQYGVSTELQGVMSPDWADYLGFTAGSLFGIPLFVLGLLHEPCAEGMGIAVKFMGFIFPLELRTGGYWWLMFLGFGTTEMVSTKLRPTRQVEVLAMAPDGTQMKAEVSLINQVVNVRRHILYATDPDELLLSVADAHTKAAIEDRDVFGNTSKEISAHREPIRNHVETSLKTIADSVGEKSTVIVREMLPPQSVLDAAAKKGIATEEAAAAAIEAAGLTDRVGTFAEANSLTRNQAIAYLQVEGGKASRMVFTPEGVDQIAELVRIGLERMTSSAARAA